MLENLIRIGDENQILKDLSQEHRKMIHGAFYGAIREITGKEPDQLDMAKHAGIETHDHLNFADYVYKKQVILRVFAPEFKHVDGKTIVNQQILQVWKTNARHRRN